MLSTKYVFSRFGRHRKPVEQGSRLSAADIHKERERDLVRQRQEETERSKARKAAQEEHDRYTYCYL